MEVWTQWVLCKVNVTPFGHHLLCTCPIAFILPWPSEKWNLFLKWNVCLKAKTQFSLHISGSTCGAWLLTGQTFSFCNFCQNFAHLNSLLTALFSYLIPVLVDNHEHSVVSPLSVFQLLYSLTWFQYQLTIMSTASSVLCLFSNCSILLPDSSIGWQSWAQHRQSSVCFLTALFSYVVPPQLAFSVLSSQPTSCFETVVLSCPFAPAREKFKIVNI